MKQITHVLNDNGTIQVSVVGKSSTRMRCHKQESRMCSVDCAALQVYTKYNLGNKEEQIIRLCCIPENIVEFILTQE